jgi:hypothetical protein
MSLPPDINGVCIARIPGPKMAQSLARLKVPVVDLYRWEEYEGIIRSMPTIRRSGAWRRA